MSNRLGGFIVGQNINGSVGTFTAVTSPTFTFGSTAGTPSVDQAVQLTTTGTLPTGLSTNTTYYVISVSTNTCQLSTTLGGSAVTFTNSSGSGVHTAVTQRKFNPFAGPPDFVEYLVVAGGGGGGGGFPGVPGGTGGGGGGGGARQGVLPVASGSVLTVTVGAGGIGQYWKSTGASGTDGGNGANSVFSTITSVYGGGGGGGANAGLNGGSGGGTGGANGTVSRGIPGQGSDGAPSSGGYSGGSGGGAGSSGNIASPSVSAWGGTGICSAISGTRTFYAGGGGAHGGSDATFAEDGGAGGGGFSGIASSGEGPNAGDGTANLGGGGGGGGNGSTVNNKSGAGGSGIVIIRYPMTATPPAFTTGNCQIKYADGYQIYIWTSSGSVTF